MQAFCFSSSIASWWSFRSSKPRRIQNSHNFYAASSPKHHHHHHVATNPQFRRAVFLCTFGNRILMRSRLSSAARGDGVYDESVWPVCILAFGRFHDSSCCYTRIKVALGPGAVIARAAKIFDDELSSISWNMCSWMLDHNLCNMMQH